jgi:hypothetical protein
MAAGGGIISISRENFSYKYSNPHTYPIEYHYFYDDMFHDCHEYSIQFRKN